MTRALARATAAMAILAVAPAARADDWWARDKALHFGASATLAVGGYGAAALFTCSRPARLLAGGGLALAAGTAKEVADRYTGGDPSMKDFTWDVLGTATGLLVALAIDAVLSARPDPTPLGQCAVPRPQLSSEMDGVLRTRFHNIPFALKQGIAQPEPFVGPLP